MATLRKSTNAALSRARGNAVTAGRIAKSAAVTAAKAGASAAVIAGSIELRKGIRKAKAAPKRLKRAKVAAVVAGTAALAAAGIAISRRRRKK